MSDSGMQSDDDVQQRADKRLSLRVTDDELERIERLRKVLQGRIRGSQYVRVTQKTVILEALDALEARFKDSERKR